mgnify:CR=1 FL=1
MKNLLLSKQKLDSNWINCSIGEPYIVRKTLLETIDLPHSLEYDFTYPCSGGYEPLVAFLEKKHNGRVVITNGAKQALSAVFAIMASRSIHSCYLKTPYWTLIPPLASLYGVTTDSHKPEYGGVVTVAPNNPDGFLPSKEWLLMFSKHCKDSGLFHIHDAVYYNNIYTSPEYEKVKFGDCQIYSFAKLWGLSGLRVGYIVCEDDNLYDAVRDYIEATTSGVSLVAQEFALDIAKSLEPKEELFMTKARNILLRNRDKAEEINPEVLSISPNRNGMFLWAKKGSKLDLEKAKINAIDGEHFGAPGYIRLNLGIEMEVMDEVIRRLNEK